MIALVVIDIVAFQSTLPRGERLHILINAFRRVYFNPRSRVGSDRRTIRRYRQAVHFNPRSRVGSDVFTVSFSVIVPYFNPRSRVGSDADGQLQ